MLLTGGNDKPRHIPAVEYYSAVKRDRLLTDTHPQVKSGNCDRGQKTDSKGYTVWVHSYNILEKANLWGQETRLAAAGAGGGLSAKGHEGGFWMMELFCALIVMVVAT